uniref:HDC03660 n=1 Tax=Drosophila melanogaster TaxID=7227 RepID=Q6IH16_DROME|nr:TPA_inf: HDC03660 [Drosophila melanogaster]
MSMWTGMGPILKPRQSTPSMGRPFAEDAPRTTTTASACGSINQLAVGPIYERISPQHANKLKEDPRIPLARTLAMCLMPIWNG